MVYKDVHLIGVLQFIYFKRLLRVRIFITVSNLIIIFEFMNFQI